MFTGRDELVRHEQNKDAIRRAEAHRLAKQVSQPGRNFAFITDKFVWLYSRLFRFKSTSDIENQSLGSEHG